jgi:hypothetical protein
VCPYIKKGVCLLKHPTSATTGTAVICPSPPATNDKYVNDTGIGHSQSTVSKESMNVIRHT